MVEGGNDTGVVPDSPNEDEEASLDLYEATNGVHFLSDQENSASEDDQVHQSPGTIPAAGALCPSTV